MSKKVINVAKRGLLRHHESYGELVRLLKYMPSATGGIYRQRKRLYESPYEIKASIARLPQEEVLSRIGEASERNAEATIPIAHLQEVFGKSTSVKEMITASDLIIFDNRIWRITQCSFTGRIGNEPLLVYLLLREKLGAKESDYE